MNKIYLLGIILIIIIFSYNTSENFENIMYYNIQNSNGLYLTTSNSLQTVTPYLLSVNKTLANNFYIDGDSNLLDSGNNYVRYYSNNLVKNYGDIIKVDKINNNYYLYFIDTDNNKNYVSSIKSDIITNSPNTQSPNDNYNLFTTSTNINNQCIFNFTKKLLNG